MSCFINPYRFAGAGGATDPQISNVKLLLSGDGTNGSTTFTDESAAAHGSASVSISFGTVNTSIAKFGSGSIRFSGGSGSVSFPDHADWTLGNSDFTIETWLLIDPTVIESDNGIVSHYNTTSNQRGWIFDYLGSLATNTLRFFASVNGTTTGALSLTGSWSPTGDTWYHVVAERSGSTFRLYANGSMLAKATSTITIFDCSSTLNLGNLGSGGEPLRGNLDELRITVGAARYNSDAGYTVPTAAFPRS